MLTPPYQNILLIDGNADHDDPDVDATPPVSPPHMHPGYSVHTQRISGYCSDATEIDACFDDYEPPSDINLFDVYWSD